MLVANNAAEQKIVLTPLYCHRRNHALEHVVTKNEVVNERSRGMTGDKEPEYPGADMMRQMKRGPQRPVLGHQFWNLPQKYSELMAPK
jgi:hypothetical protein